MKTIRDLFPADRLDRPIEEVINLDEQTEQSQDAVRREIEEYVTTEQIQKDYDHFLREYSDGLSNPDARIGVWIAGFFGSGKSSFAKNLGYILRNTMLDGVPASDLFIARLREHGGNSDRARNLEETIRFINARIRTRVIMFDVRVISSQGSEPIHQLMYTKLLNDLDYATDFDIAELEIELEGEGRLGAFIQSCARLFRDETSRPKESHPVPVTLAGTAQDDYDVWVMVRKGSLAFQRIVAALREVSPGLYDSSDSASLLRGRAHLNIEVLVARTFELASRRAPGHAVTFIIDEVGSYVAQSVNKIEDLRKLVEHFGQEGASRVRTGKAVAPVWVVVTSQEKLDEVVQAIDDKRIELARLQDRFAVKINMSPSDIREVASLRVLKKTDSGRKRLNALYDEHIAQLKTHTRLQQQKPTGEATRDEFAQYYPYLPHFIDLSIEIVSGLRSQSGAFKQLGGSNRTIIKQAHEMLVGERTDLQHQPVGELVTLDRIYDLVEGNLSNEKRTDVSDIERRWKDNVWAVRTAKAITLLEFVRGTPRTAENIAALLYRRLGDNSPLADVQAAIDELSGAEFIRQTDTGWKLLSLQEKTWVTKRSSFSPTPRDRNAILEEQLRSIFQEKALARHTHGVRTFQVDVRWNDRVIVDGKQQIPLTLDISEEVSEIEFRRSEIRGDSNNPRHLYYDQIFWFFALNDDIDSVVEELYRSRRMVSEYEGLRSQGSLNAEDTKSLADEKTSALKYDERLRNLVMTALVQGKALFRGVSGETMGLHGTRPSEMFGQLFQFAVPKLYPKLELGAHRLKGNEAEDMLKAANLQGLTPIFYGAPDGLELVKKDERTNKWVVNLEAPIIREIKNYLDSEHSYGNKVTGKSLEGKFGGIGYGWEQEIVWLAVATLLRGGAIEVTYQGRRYRHHVDPQVRAPFSGANAFRSASFAPRKAPDLQMLVSAARNYETLTGDEVDIEESAVAHAMQTLARRELENLLPLEATVKANSIDSIDLVRDLLTEYRTSLQTILNSASDDVVNILAGEWKSFQESQNRIDALRKSLDDDGLKHLVRTRIAVQRIVPMLQAEGIDADVQSAAELLQQSLDSADYFDRSRRNTINSALQLIETAYGDAFVVRHTERKKAIVEAIQQITSLPAWDTVLSNVRQGGDSAEDVAQRQATLEEELLKPLISRGDLDIALPDRVVFDETQPPLAQMASDIAAIDRLRSDIVMRVQKLAAPEERIERVRLSSIDGTGQVLGNEEDVNSLLERVKTRLLNVVQSGAKVILE